MRLWQGSKAQLVAVMAAAIGIPFYLVVHMPLPQLVLYTGVAGAAMATGDYVETPMLGNFGVPLFLTDAALWTSVIAIIGAVAYMVALIF